MAIYIDIDGREKKLHRKSQIEGIAREKVWFKQINKGMK